MTTTTRRNAMLLAALVAGLPIAAHAQAERSITVYTSQPSEQMAAVIAAFNADHPDIKVELFRSGTTEVMNKLQAEFTAGSVQADVLLIADTLAMTRLKEEGRLFAYADAPVADLPEALVDPERTFFGTKLITTGIMYNTDLVETPPASWNDLLAEDAASRLIMPSPLYSGAAVIHVGTMVQQPEFGWDYYATLADEGAVAGQGNGSVVEAVARGEKAYGIIIEYMALNAKAKGSPVDFVFPEEGVSAITQPVAILRDSDAIDAAKVFVDWQLSAKAQEQSVQQGYFPVISGMAPPAGYPDPASLNVLEADDAQMLKDEEASKREFADLFGG